MDGERRPFYYVYMFDSSVGGGGGGGGGRPALFLRNTIPKIVLILHVMAVYQLDQR